MLRRGVKRIKSKKAQLGLGGIVMMVMIIFVCLVLINEIFNQQTHMTTRNSASDTVSIATAKINGDDFNGTFGITASTAVTNGLDDQWKVDECNLGSVVVRNVTNSAGGTLTETTDYTFNAATGVLNVLNTSDNIARFATNNNSVISYTYCEDGYNTDSGSRGIAGIIGLFAVLALFIIIAGMGIKEWASN